MAATAWSSLSRVSGSTLSLLSLTGDARHWPGLQARCAARPAAAAVQPRGSGRGHTGSAQITADLYAPCDRGPRPHYRPERSWQTFGSLTVRQLERAGATSAAGTVRRSRGFQPYVHILHGPGTSAVTAPHRAGWPASGPGRLPRFSFGHRAVLRWELAWKASYHPTAAPTQLLAVVLLLNPGLVATLVRAGLAAHSRTVCTAGADYHTHAVATAVSPPIYCSRSAVMSSTPGLSCCRPPFRRRTWPPRWPGWTGTPGRYRRAHRGTVPGATRHCDERLPEMPDLTACPGGLPGPGQADVSAPGCDASGTINSCGPGNWPRCLRLTAQCDKRGHCNQLEQFQIADCADVVIVPT
jgi:hypothetical protein